MVLSRKLREEQDSLFSVSIVIPCYFSSQTLRKLTKSLIEVCTPISSELEIIFTDDGSKDDTWAVIAELANQDSRIRGLRFSKNFGQHKAIMAGLRESKNDFVIVMDADFQDNPTDIPKLLMKSRKDQFEIVLANRTGKRHGFFKRFGSKVFSKVFSYSSGIRSDSAIGNFGVYSRKVIDEIERFGDRDFLLGNLVTWTGLSSTSVNVVHNERLHGKSTYSMKKLFGLAYSVLMSNSNLPLRLIVSLGSIFSILSILMASLIAINYFLVDAVPSGWTSVIVAILLSTGLLLMSMGIVGLYIGRIFDFTKQRPLYIVAERTLSPN